MGGRGRSGGCELVGGREGIGAWAGCELVGGREKTVAVWTGCELVEGREETGAWAVAMAAGCEAAGAAADVTEIAKGEVLFVEGVVSVVAASMDAAAIADSEDVGVASFKTGADSDTVDTATVVRASDFTFTWPSEAKTISG